MEKLIHYSMLVLTPYFWAVSAYVLYCQITALGLINEALKEASARVVGHREIRLFLSPGGRRGRPERLHVLYTGTEEPSPRVEMDLEGGPLIGRVVPEGSEGAGGSFLFRLWKCSCKFMCGAYLVIFIVGGAIVLAEEQGWIKV